MKKQGFTLVELLIILAIICILSIIICSGVGGCRTMNGYYGVKGSGTYQCIKTYVMTRGSDGDTQTEKRVDLKPANGDQIETFVCDDNLWLGIYNSATIYGQFEPGKWYNIQFTGYRKEGYILHWFPTITSVSRIERIEQ